MEAEEPMKVYLEEYGERRLIGFADVEDQMTALWPWR